MNIKLLIQIAIGITGYTVWGTMAYLDVSLRADFLKFNVAMAVGTIGLVLRDMQSGNTTTPSVSAAVAEPAPVSMAAVSAAPADTAVASAPAVVP